MKVEKDLNYRGKRKSKPWGEQVNAYYEITSISIKSALTKVHLIIKGEKQLNTKARQQLKQQ